MGLLIKWFLNHIKNHENKESKLQTAVTKCLLLKGCFLIIQLLTNSEDFQVVFLSLFLTSFVSISRGNYAANSWDLGGDSLMNWSSASPDACFKFIFFRFPTFTTLLLAFAVFRIIFLFLFFSFSLAVWVYAFLRCVYTHTNILSCILFYWCVWEGSKKRRVCLMSIWKFHLFMCSCLTCFSWTANSLI